MNPRPVTVTVTGATGQIVYALLFRIAPGNCSGPTHPYDYSCWRPPGRPRRRGHRD